MSVRESILDPATTRTQAVVGAAISSALGLLIGFGLHQGADSTIFTAALIAIAVQLIGLKRTRTWRR